MTPIDRKARIYVAGHRGLVGSAVVRRLQADGFSNLLTRTSTQLDLREQSAVRSFFDAERPQYVFLCAAKVGGIAANMQAPGEFIYNNLLIAANVIEAARLCATYKLINLSSSCTYPRQAPQPLREETMLSGPLEETNRAYAVAKIAASELCDAYRTQYGCNFVTAIPTNIYGPHDNFDPESSHVLAALLSRIEEARVARAPQVEIWGTGTPFREFLYVDDLADACLFVMEHFEAPGGINVGTGREISIAQLAQLLKEIVGYQGELVFNSDRPDGMQRKRLDVGRLEALGWTAHTSLRDGIERTLQWYRTRNAPS